MDLILLGKVASSICKLNVRRSKPLAFGRIYQPSNNLLSASMIRGRVNDKFAPHSALCRPRKPPLPVGYDICMICSTHPKFRRKYPGQNESQSNPVLKWVEGRRIYLWLGFPLLTCIYPGFDCGSNDLSRPSFSKDLLYSASDSPCLPAAEPEQMRRCVSALPTPALHAFTSAYSQPSTPLGQLHQVVAFPLEETFINIPCKCHMDLPVLQPHQAFKLCRKLTCKTSRMETQENIRIFEVKKNGDPYSSSTRSLAIEASQFTIVAARSATPLLARHPSD